MNEYAVPVAGKKENYSEKKSISVPLCLPQIPNGRTWIWVVLLRAAVRYFALKKSLKALNWETSRPAYCICRKPRGQPTAFAGNFAACLLHLQETSRPAYCICRKPRGQPTAFAGTHSASVEHLQ
jgi:hypothetical protein